VFPQGDAHRMCCTWPDSGQRRVWMRSCRAGPGS
jgi:hypothetical protein